MGSIFSPKPSPPPALPPPPPPPPPVDPSESPEAIAAGKRQKAAALKAKGRKSTVLTGGTGLTTVAPTVKKSLLGE